MDKLQIAAGDQRKSPRGKVVVMKQRRPRTKAALHKVLEGNAARGKETEASGGRRREESGDTKAVDILTSD